MIAMATAHQDSKLTIWFHVPVLGLDPATGEEFVSSRHFVVASQVVQHSDLTEFIDRFGEVVASWKTRDVDHWTWFIDVSSETPPVAEKVVANTSGVGSKEWLAKIKLAHPRAYEPWPPDEDMQLRKEFSDGMAQEEIAKIHQRRKGAISSRLKKLELI